MTLALVTGASGFLGSHLVEALLASGYRVRCLVRRTSSLSWLAPDRVELFYGAVTEPAALAEAARGEELIFHLAGVTRTLRRADYEQVNAEACGLGARAAAASGGRRILLVSSLAAGGPSAAGRPRREEDPDAPVGPYGLSKLRGEALLKAQAGRTAWTILRPSAVYGPRDASFLLLARFAKRGWAPAIGGPAQPLSLLHARDLAEALLAAAACEGAAGRTYYLAHPEPANWESIARLMAARMERRVRRLRIPRWGVRAAGWGGRAGALLSGRTDPLPADRLRDLLAPAWVCDPARAREELGFRARVDHEAGFAETIDWYRAEGLL